MRPRKRRIKLQRFCDSRPCLRHSLPRGRASLLGISQPKVGHRQLGVGWRISRVLLNGSLEVRNRCLQSKFGPFAAEIQALQVIVLRLRVNWATGGEASPLLRCQLDLDFVSDGACNLALQTQSISNIA